MDTDKPLSTTGSQVAKALAEADRNRPRPSRDPKVWEFASSLDAMQFSIGRYLVNVLKVPTYLLPELIPLIDPRCVQDRLEEEVAYVLRELEESE